MVDSVIRFPTEVGILSPLGGMDTAVLESPYLLALLVCIPSIAKVHAFEG